MADPFVASNRYETWITRLRLPWMGVVARRIFGGFAAALGDASADWARQGLVEHFPRWASAEAIALIASERQLDVSPYETTADIAARAPYAVKISKFYGSALGLLLGLHFSGFDGAVVVQQNGLAHQLTLPLPDFSGDWDPTPNHVITTLGGNPTLAGAAAGHAWWTFDLDDSFCSRFAVLFPSSSAPFTTWGRATFAASDTAPVTWNNPFSDTTYNVIVGGPIGDAPVIAGYASKTTTGLTAQLSGTFTGTVDYWAYPVGATNPFVWITAENLSRLQAVIKKWRPAKATCVGVYVLVQGRFWDWPIAHWDDPGLTWGPSADVVFQGA